MKEIIVLGGGFAGVSACLRLKKVIDKNVNITLIDKNQYHLFTPSLYEVATSEEPKKNIAIPFSEIFENGIKIIQGEAEAIDIQNKLVNLKDKANYYYDYLIIALGSEPSFFGVEGLEKYSIPLKSLEDASKIKKTIESIYHEKAQAGKKIKVIVGGGGFSGTEFAAELVKYRERLSKHHNRPVDLLEITVIQGSPCLLKELDEKVSEIARKRLEKNGVKIILGAHIEKVTEDKIETDDNKNHPYDVFIWTGGVKASSVLSKSGFKTNGKGQVAVDKTMMVVNLNHGSIFAAGDIAEFADPVTNKPAPGVAEVAKDEGEIAAENVYKKLTGQDLISYNYKHLGYIIPLKGKFAVCDLTFLKTTGFLGWVIQQFVFLQYLLGIMPITKALKRWNKFEMFLMGS